ncbi:ABC transporter permease [Aeoliella sp.]|uniref:ABC transporter permease n=1 Tax=Aeoliella sp. TaxID=2795800 RepID=UPI003CCBB18C
MIGYFVKRGLWLLLTVWVVFTLTWLLANASPGSPFSSERSLPAEIEANLRRHYNLDKPAHVRYLLDLGNLLRGDLGVSSKQVDFTVNELVSLCWPVSAALGLAALAWAAVVGLVAGVVSAARRGSLADYSLMSIATVGIALPNFVIAGFAILLFSFLIPLLPPAGWGSPRYLLMPAFCLGAPYAAYIARISRTGMLDVLSQDYIRTARAKGLSRRAVILKHALPTAVIPVVSFLGPAVAGIITGSLVIEKLFAIPGIGYSFVQSAIDNDTPMAMGIVVLYTILLFTMNTLVDAAYTWLDPRVSWEDV